jgi:hypothetical protein
MPAPSVPSTHLDLLDASVATLATIGPDGRPQVSGVWFLADDGVVKVSLNVARQKTKNLTADRLGAKYGGVDLRAMDGPDGRRVVVTVKPVRINAVDLSAG